MIDRWIRLKSLLSRRRALQRFGDHDHIRDKALKVEKGRRQDKLRALFLDGVRHDMRYALRTFRRNPFFTLAAVISIAIGIGANTAVLTFVHEFLIDPLPFKDSSRIVAINCSAPTLGIERYRMNFNELEYFRLNAHSLSGVTAHELTDVTIRGVEEPQRLFASRVSENFFDIIGVPPLHGRAFIADDALAGASGTVVLGYGLWQSLYGGDPDLVGQTVRLNEEAFTVIGIMPPGVAIPMNVQIWMPFREDRLDEVVRGRVRFLGRMTDGVSTSDVRNELDALFVLLTELYPDESVEKRATVSTLRASYLIDFRKAVFIFYAVVSLVLLLACANVANLLLARGAARNREIAVRASLGAGKSRIVRQLFTESLFLALLGGIIGLLLGQWGRDLILAGSNLNWPPYFEFKIDLTVVSILVGITLVTSLFFGLLPALVSSRPDIATILHGTSGRMTGGRTRIWHQGLLVSFEVGLAVMVLIAGGLMVKSFIGVQRLDMGFDPENVIHMEINLASLGEFSGEERVRYYSDLIARIEEHPEVESAAAGNPLPYIGWEGSYETESAPALSEDASRTAIDATVTPGFFHTLGMTLVRGRDFLPADAGEGSRRVAVVSERLVELNWPGEDPLGKRLRFKGSEGREYPWMEVVGVVKDTRAGTFQPDIGWIIVPQGQWPAYELILAVRTYAEPQRIMADIKQMVWDDNPELAMQWNGILDQTIRERYSEPSQYSLLLSIFSILALIMACVGVYGVVNYSVVRRAREFGIRLSVGARPVDVVRQVMVQGGRLIMWGILGGLVGAVVLMRLASSLFFGVDPHDLGIYTLCTGVLVLIALMAIWVPAHRAARVDPVHALRVE